MSLLAFTPAASTSTGFTLENFSNVFATTDVVWLQNSLLVTLGTVVVSVIVAAPAGYVLSRGRSRAVSGYSLLLFVFQSLPVITAVIPLFLLFANLGLIDNLMGLTIVYVGTSMAVATWMMAAYMDSIPISLEEAAWIDGSSVFRGFSQVVLRNSLPGRAVHRDLHVPGGLERLPRRHRVPALGRHLHHARGRTVVLPAEHHRLGLGDGRRRRHDAPAHLVFAV